MRDLVFLLIVILPFTVSAQKQWTLQECVERGLRQNIALKRADIDVQVQKSQADASRKTWLPRVQADVAGTLSYGMNMDLIVRHDFLYAPFSVSAEMPIDINGGIRNQAKADALELKALLADREKAANDLSLSICSAYLQALYVKSILRIAEEEVTFAKERLEMVNSLVEEGARSEGERTEALSSLAEAEHTRLQYSNIWEKERMALAQMLLIEDYGTFDIAEVGDNLSISDLDKVQNEAIDYAHANNAALRSAQLRVKASEYDVKVAKSELYPKLTLRGYVGAFAYTGLKSGETLEDFNNVWRNRNEQVSLNLSIPIFNAFATRVRIKQAVFKTEDSRLAADEEWIKLKHEIEQAYLAAKSSQSEYLSAQNKSRQYQEAYDYQRNRYESGIGTWLELREADSNLQKSLYGVQQSRIQCIMNQKILEFYKGESIR